MELHLYKDPTALSVAAAEWITYLVAEKLRTADRFTIALSGGSTPQKLHTLLASPPFRDRIAWEKMHIFWGDERAVPFEDERNNAKMAFDTLLNQVNVLPGNIHVMRTDVAPDIAAKEYEALLHTYFDNRSTSFDLVLLGMGDDGHTLSLFPGTDIVHENKAWVSSFFLPAQDMYRISLTAPIVNRSAAIAFLTTGPKKSAALRQVLEGNFNPDCYPSQIIKADNGEVHWFVDEAAAAELKQTGSHSD